jgi:hypothetical protein
VILLEVGQDTFAILLEDGKGGLRLRKRTRWLLYLVGRTDGLEVKFCQSLNDIAAALEEISPYERSKSEEFFARVAILVNDLHLLDYCRLSGLAGTCRRDTGCACKCIYGNAMLSAKQEQVGRGCVRVCACITKGSVFGVGRG